jgi:hypothetical protein
MPFTQRISLPVSTCT